MTKSAAELTAHKHSFDGGVQTAWDATSLDLAQTCARKYYYANILGITPKHKSVHLIFGGIYASALEQFYKSRAKGASIEDATIEVVRTALTASWNKETGLPVEFDDPKKTRVALIRTIVWYIEQFANETDHGIKTYHLENGEPAAELSFKLPLESDIMYCGHLDRVVTYAGDNYVMDQKTTGSTVGSYYFSGFDISNQMTGYSMAGKVILKTPIKGVIIDAAQIMAQSTRFERGMTMRSEGQLEEWLNDTIAFIEAFQHASEREQFPMNPNSCFNYGGCPYKGLCAVDPKIRKHYIKSDFVSHNWDPAVPR